MTSTGRPAMLLTTDLVVLCRHLDLVGEIRGRGLEPVVVLGPDTTADELAQRRADPSHPFHDVDEIVHLPDYSSGTLLETVLELRTRLDLRAILNCGELFVDSAGELAETLGLPGPGGKAARTARNKLLQRLAVPGLAPRWTPLGTGRDASVAADQGLYPAVLKPVGRMSSSGVRAVGSPAELAEALPGYPDGEFLLLESRVRGPEFSVESFVHDGEVVWAGVTAKSTNEDGTSWFTETGHTSPAELGAADRDALLAANASLLASLSFGSGMSHAEFRLGPDGPVLMEIAARPPGDAITRLWQLATGAAVEPALVDMALGVRPSERPGRRRARQVYLDPGHGRLRDVVCAEAPVTWITDHGAWPRVTPAAADAPARLCAVVVTRRRGDLLGDQADSGGRAVSVVVDCGCDDDADAVAARLAKTVTVELDEQGAA